MQEEASCYNHVILTNLKLHLKIMSFGDRNFISDHKTISRCTQNFIYNIKGNVRKYTSADAGSNPT